MEGGNEATSGSGITQFAEGEPKCLDNSQLKGDFYHETNSFNYRFDVNLL